LITTRADRRTFLRLFGAALVGAGVVDPEKLIWTPTPIITVPAMPYRVFITVSPSDFFPFTTSMEQVQALSDAIDAEGLRRMYSVVRQGDAREFLY